LNEIDQRSQGKVMDNDLERFAVQFGSSLARSQPVLDYRAALDALEADNEATSQKASLEQVYDDLVRRQSQGEFITQGEIESYYALEQRVLSNPLLVECNTALERVKDYFSEAHNILCDHLGVTFVDLI
jgi:cell fate (sporulation/competence/biofilm development) regulator YlbF (YheA/YmcA/DUF963 family)